MPELVLGRDAELTVVDAFLAGVSSAPGALVLTGTAGVGKTTVLRAGLQRAATSAIPCCRQHQRLVTCDWRSLPADLLESRLEGLLPELPTPQRRALGAALHRQDAPANPLELHITAVAFRSALRLLAAEVPVLVVIDDVQWLDAPDGIGRQFRFPPATDERIGLLLAMRTADPDVELPLDRTAGMSVESVPLGGLSMGRTAPDARPSTRPVVQQRDGCTPSQAATRSSP